jgi:hypothetical protein
MCKSEQQPRQDRRTHANKGTRDPCHEVFGPFGFRLAFRTKHDDAQSVANDETRSRRANNRKRNVKSSSE